ncbi:DUF6894 family protein [Rhizobium leguminosarum]|uniref:DUF6894 family protein n=1 Tax=Rhizobium leguminosarum TaxID=384 RepID=UPI001C9258A8|nr:hypothetical protein [Rhizobium leguminosarum]MBY3044221.1 hypothetical protein [Rhizobium leguminosarum]
MPRYFFNLVGSETVTDIEGSELDSLEAAREEAIKDARAIMSDAILAGHDVSERRVEIRDEEGTLLAEVPFSDAVSKRI